MKWPRLFELEDQRWLPQILRDQMTDALRYLIIEMKVYAPIIPELLWVMQQSPTKDVVDLCSGGSGPWDYLLAEISESEEFVARITLTDLYPNERAFKALSESRPIISYQTEPVNALDISADLEGLRTLFSSFHHFDLPAATSIIQDAVDKQMPIGIFEFTERRAVNFLITPITTIMLFSKMLFRTQLSLSRLLFSYLIPIVPLIFLWDSNVSHLRSYSQDNLKEIIRNVHNSDSYEWEVGENRSPKTPIKNTYLIGYPKRIGC